MNEITTKVTITSLDIAERTGKQHRNVRVDIRKMLGDLDLTSADFSADLPDSYGRMQPGFILPKREALILATGYSTKLRANLIDRLEELETKVKTVEAQSAKVQAMLAPPDLYQSHATRLLTEDEKQELKALALKDAQAQLTAVVGRRLQGFMKNLLVEDVQEKEEWWAESPVGVDQVVMNLMFYLENALKFMEIDAKIKGKSIHRNLDGYKCAQLSLTTQVCPDQN